MADATPVRLVSSFLFYISIGPLLIALWLPVTLSCSDQGNGHGYCAPVSTTVSGRSVTPSFISVSITTTTATTASTKTTYIPWPEYGSLAETQQRWNEDNENFVRYCTDYGGCIAGGDCDWGLGVESAEEEEGVSGVEDDGYAW